MRKLVPPIAAILLATGLCAACVPSRADPAALGRGLYEAGRYDAAEPHLRRALADAERRTDDPVALADALYALGQLYWAEGRHPEAEPLLERAAAVRERVLGPGHPAFAQALNRWATLYLDEERPARAGPLLERALAILEGGAGEPGEAGGDGLADVLGNLGLLRERQGRFGEAEALYRRALEADERRHGPRSREAATRLASLGTLHLAEGRHADAEALLRRALAIREAVLPPGHPRIAASLASLGALEASRGRHAEAEALIRRSLDLRERAFGRASAQAAADHVLLANLHLLRSRPADALEELGHVAASRHGAGPDPHLSAGGGGLEQTRAHRARVRAGWALLAQAPGPADRAAVVDEAFGAGQRVHASDAGAAVARLAARFAARDDALARLVREQQDLAARWRELDLALLGEAGSPAATGSSAGLDALDRDLAATGARLDALGRELARRFPDYQTLVSPEPVGAAEVQALLGPDEALLAYLVLPADPEWLEEAGVYLWAVRPGREPALLRLGLDPPGLDAAVRRLREGLDPERWAEGARDGPPPFDLEEAHRLHDLLLPLATAGLLAGTRHLLVVPDGPLESLPLAVLVRTPPAPPGAARARVDWLARELATTTLPSVASLRALRRIAGTSAAPEPFRGVGDPALGAVVVASAADAAAVLPPPHGHRGGGLVEPALLQALPPLPETAQELRALAARLGAGESSLLLREAATERAVKAGALKRARVVAFATHAGVAGQLPGLAEPALVLTPPAVPSAEDDGLLTAAEAAHLDLDADLVLLSACNTAAPDGTPGAPGLSGLASAFIYAGSRALLVSHWAVISDAAGRLTTGMLDELARDPELGRAEALRRSMVALLDDPGRPNLAHPAAWAPFVVVGQGGAPARFR